MGKQKSIFGILAVCVVLYAALTFSIPPDTATLDRYDITATRLRLLSLSIAIPLVAIWWAAFYGFAKCQEYAALIRQSPDGRAFSKLAHGLAVLAIGLPVSSITSAALRYAARLQPELTAAVSIINNYIGIIIALVAFILIGQGAQRLLGLGTSLNSRRPALPRQLLLSAAFLVFGSLYAYLVLTHTTHQPHIPTAEKAIYHLPLWLTMTTIILPYLYIWYTGLMAALYINFYRKNVPGILYKKALRFLAWGIGAVIISSILLQYLTAMEVITSLSLASLLIIIYGLLIVISAGYILIALGAKRLKRLEEV